MMQITNENKLYIIALVAVLCVLVHFNSSDGNNFQFSTPFTAERTKLYALHVSHENDIRIKKAPVNK